MYELAADEVQEVCFRPDFPKHSIITSLHGPRDAEHLMPTPQFKRIGPLYCRAHNCQSNQQQMNKKSQNDP